MKKNTTEIGNRAERVAEAYYLERGYRLVVRNFRSHVGELDLILAKGRELLVVEVKGRGAFNPDEAWLTRWSRKKRKMRDTLRWYLARDPFWIAEVEEYRLEIVFVTQGRVSERYEDEPFF